MFFRRKQPKTVGSQGEDLATRYLKDKGYAILERNFANPKGYRLGEIDIIAQKDGTIVFVEVKTRHRQLSDREEIILPEAAITPDKMRKLSRIAEYYLKKTKQLHVPHRFDALAIVIDTTEKTAKIRHLESIFF